MKFLIVFACAFAVSSAGIAVPLVYSAPQHLPIIGPNGVPIDTPEVQNARAAHLAHKIEAHARNGDFVVPYINSEPIIAAYPTTAVLPLNGAPLETPEVVAAKANHFAAHAEALARNGNTAVLYRKRRGIYAAAPLTYTTPLLPPTYTHTVLAAPYVNTYTSAYHPYAYARHYSYF